MTNTSTSAPEIDENHDICRNRHGGNEFSESAHDSIVGDKKRQAKLILGFIEANPGSTCDHIEQVLDLKHQTASARISELKKAGLIAVNGRAATSSGRTAATYVSSPASV